MVVAHAEIVQCQINAVISKVVYSYQLDRKSRKYGRTQKRCPLILFKKYN